jgi:hypothetical protein
MANMAKINDWLQVVGMFGLIASLVSCPDADQARP